MNREKRAQPAPASPLDAAGDSGSAVSAIAPLVRTAEQSGMEPSSYSEALKSLRNAGYIEFIGEGFEGVIRLTPSGAQVVQLRTARLMP